MRGSGGKCLAVLSVMAICLLSMVPLAWAVSQMTSPPIIDEAAEISESDEESTPAYLRLSTAELYRLVGERRIALLETRMEVVKKANEAKQRLEELIKTSKLSQSAAEALRKDLDTIKETQRILTIILSDIVNAVPGSESAVQPGIQTGIGGATSVPGDHADAGEAAKEPEILAGAPATIRSEDAQNKTMPSREYLEGLITLYEEKNQQLIKVVGSLDSIVKLN